MSNTNIKGPQGPHTPTIIFFEVKRPIVAHSTPSLTMASANTLLEYYKRDNIRIMLAIQEIEATPFEELYPDHDMQFWSAYAQNDLELLKVLHGHFLLLLKKFDE